MKEEIIFPHGKNEVITSPLKQVIDRWENSGSIVKDIKNIHAENDYTNILLKPMTNELSRIESNPKSKESKRDKKTQSIQFSNL